MADASHPTPAWHTLRLTRRLDGEAGMTRQSKKQTLAAIEAGLFAAGALAVTVADAEDHPLNEPLPGELPLWPKVTIEALFAADQSMDQTLIELQQAGLISTDDAFELHTLEDQAWTRAWMDDFQPMAFGQRLWVCPTHATPDPAWPVVVRLDPGLAFGSGTHPTTALCLRWLDHWAQTSEGALATQTVIDFGCGSSILAVAAAKLGAITVWATDHDEQALVATVDNAQANGVGAAIHTQPPEAFFKQNPPPMADVVLANILAKPLIELAPELMGLVRPGGHLVLSGILQDQAKAVKDAYRGLDDQPTQTHEGDWVRLVFAQRGGCHYNEPVPDNNHTN